MGGIVTTSSSISREGILAACKKLEGLGHKKRKSFSDKYMPDLKVDFSHRNTTPRFFDTSYVFSPANPAVGYKDPVKIASMVILIKLYGRSRKDFDRPKHPYLTIPQS